MGWFEKLPFPLSSFWNVLCSKWTHKDFAAADWTFVWCRTKFIWRTTAQKTGTSQNIKVNTIAFFFHFLVNRQKKESRSFRNVDTNTSKRFNFKKLEFRLWIEYFSLVQHFLFCSQRELRLNANFLQAEKHDYMWCTRTMVKEKKDSKLKKRNKICLT